MALRIGCKINRLFNKDVCRSLSAKRDLPELEVASKSDDATKSSEANVPPCATQGHVPYQVCQPRNFQKTLGSLQRAAQNESDVAKNHMAMQHLQPALLPEFFKPPVEINSCMYPDGFTETEKQSSAKNARHFEDSMTRMNLTLPLKVPKLANPFPDPVKVMSSHTISDQEKAELMLAEQKMATRMAASTNSQNSRQQHGVGQAMNQHPIKHQRRFYSSQHGHGHTGKGHGSGHNDRDGHPQRRKKVCDLRPRDSRHCKHFKIVHTCKPATSTRCPAFHKDRHNLPPCKKRPAPYPAYSEMCVDKPFKKPTECRMCPWRLDKHPHFKPSKKGIHTKREKLWSKKRGECSKPADLLKKPCGWVELEKKREKEEKNKRSVPKKAYNMFQNAEMLTYSRDASSICTLQTEKPMNYMFQAKKKQPCKSGRHETCEENRERKEREDKKSSNKDQNTKNKPKTASSLSDEIGVWMKLIPNMKTPFQQATDVSKNQLYLDSFGATPEEYSLHGKCTKFPFKQVSFPLVKERPMRPPKLQHGECPKKPMPKRVHDCPPDKAGECKKIVYDPLPEIVNSGGRFGYLTATKGSGKDNKNNKCPKLGGRCDQPEEKDGDDPNDPCGLTKKHPKTYKCPTDLLKTHTPGYRKPTKKRTASLIPPVSFPQSTPTMKQPISPY